MAKMEEIQKEKSRNRQWKHYLIIGCLLLIPSLFVLISYRFVLESSSMPQVAEAVQYQYHIAMITENAGNPFWDEVYAGAVRTAGTYNAYVELVGDGLVEQFSIEDSVDMAVYENVDGILIQPSESEDVQQMIDKAEAHGIPVITLQRDVSASKRRGFVGTNDYFLGQEYGRRVLKIADADTKLITVLIPGATYDTTSQEWFRSGLENALQGEQITLDFRIIRDDHGLNNAEDVIHNMVEAYLPCPDIMICLDSVITQTAYQIIEGKEVSEEIAIIGSDVTEAILTGIENGVIDSTITVDAKRLGQLGVEALMTYKKYHMVSYYTEVGTQVIEQQNLALYREEAQNEGE